MTTLKKSGDLTKMLHYGKSDLVKVKPTFGGEAFELDARLSFKKDGEGNNQPRAALHPQGAETG